MPRRKRRASKIESSINVTPMGDVSLSLLLGFLVITPIIIQTLLATLPQGGGVASGQVKQDPVVVLTAEGKILINAEEVFYWEPGDTTHYILFDRPEHGRDAMLAEMEAFLAR